MDEAVRDRLAVALDFDDLVAASRLARSLVGHFRVAKIGLELYTAAGPEAIGAMIDLGYDVFCDLKLHDIPTTVARAARVVGELGVSYLTVHAAGGTEMLRAGAEGLAEGATRPAGVLAVTVLTSDAAVAATRDLVAERMELAFEAGCAGVVCAAPDLTATRHIRPELIGLFLASGSLATPWTTSGAWRRRFRPWSPARTCWSWAGPSQGPPIP